MKYSELKQKVLKRNALIKVIKNIVPVLNIPTTVKGLNIGTSITKKQANLIMNKFDWVEVGRDYKSFYVKFDNIKLRGSRVYHLWDIYVCFSKGSQTYPKITYYNIVPCSNDEELLSFHTFSKKSKLPDCNMVNDELLIPAKHPHISTGTGDACLGDFEKSIYNCLGIYNYAAALLTIKQFLLSWNVDSPYWNVNDCYNYFFRTEQEYKYLTYAELVYIYISEWGRNASVVANMCEFVKRKTGKFDTSWIDKVNRFQICQQDKLDRFLADVAIDKHPFLEMWHRIVRLKGSNWTWGSNAQTSIANCEKLDLIYNDFRVIISSFRTKVSHTFSKFDIIYYYYNHPLGNQWRRNHWDIIMKKRMEQILNKLINEIALTGGQLSAARKRRLLRGRGIGTLFQEGTNLDNVDKLLYDSGIIAYRMAIKNSKESIRRLKNEVNDFKASFDQT